MRNSPQSAKLRVTPVASPGSADHERIATADYIATMMIDLIAMAHGQRLDTLAYILDMARREAESACRNNTLQE